MTFPLRLGSALAICFAASASAAPAGWKTYTQKGLGWSIAYPASFVVDDKHASPSPLPDQTIAGVAFEIPESMTTGTNLGSGDTGVIVESLPGRDCKPSQFVDPADAVRPLKADGRTYTMAGSEDAGAGNLYETRIFVVNGTSPCIAVRYLVHSTNIANYDPGTVKAFDEKKLTALFDGIRATLTLTK
ncbi:MAG: hypothetical protein WDN03_19555 [Rhizomicrobium sp.]